MSVWVECVVISDVGEAVGPSVVCGDDSWVSRETVLGSCDCASDMAIHLLKAPALAIYPRWDCRYHRIPVIDFVIS